MRHTVLISLFFAALSLQYPQTVKAEEGAIASLVVHNQSSSTIEYFYLSVDTPFNWGPSLFGYEVLETNYKITVNPATRPDGFCTYDWMAIFMDGEVQSGSTDLCDDDPSLYIYDRTD